MRLGGTGTSRLGRRATACALGCMLACAPGLVRAQAAGPALELTWSAPAGCASREQVLQRVLARLPEAPSAGAGVRVAADVTTAHGFVQLSLVLHAGEHAARRELRVQSCQEAADVAALLIALALDPSLADDAQTAGALGAAPHAPHGEEADAHALPPRAQGGAPAPTPERARAGPPVPSERPRSTRAPAVTRPSREAPEPETDPLQLGFRAGAGLALDFGTLPQRPALGVRPWVALSIERLRLGAAALLLAPDHAHIERGGGEVEARALGGELSLGLELLRARVLLVPYALGELARITMSTTAITDPGSGDATWAALGGGLQAGYGFRRSFSVTLDVSVVAPLQRARWLVRTAQGDVPVVPVPDLALRLALGLAYAVP